MSSKPIQSDYLVLGTGLAGLFFALKASRFGQVTVLAKAEAKISATSLAQGGIAGVHSPEDSFSNHISDTLKAGAGLCHENIVKMCVEDAPERILDLVKFGVVFDKADGGYALTREGGHSHDRILHSFDQTGIAIASALLKACKKNPNIKIIENQMAIDLILSEKHSPSPCLGAYVLDLKSKSVFTYTAKATILATGGAGKVYLYTSNWDGATGDGVAMAKRAGARIANMEFLQFHPTCLFHPEARNFLISEALRGEGGRLVLKDGSEFMKKYHELGALAPRDIVARAIDGELKRTGDDCVFIDITHKPAKELRTRFPGIYEKCLQYGIDMTAEPIPVVPAAHYMCGGVLTDQFGQTDVPRLYAIGETACTGLHGANRLASNSLLEAIVFAHNAANKLEQLKPEPIASEIKPWDPGNAAPADEMIVVSHNWDEIRRLMWNYVGIVRSTKRLLRAQSRIQNLQEEIKEFYWKHLVEKDILELRNIALVAELIIKAALWRKESRGIHYTIDYPNPDPAFEKDSVF